MTQRTQYRPLVAVAIGILSVIAVACGGSSSSSTTTTQASGSAATTQASSAVATACAAAKSALEQIGTAIKQDAASINYPELDRIISSGAQPAQQCQTAVRAAVSGLPSNAQSAATNYASSLTSVISLLQNPPANAAAGTTWLSQVNTQLPLVAAAKTALDQVAPSLLG